jgi:hypothetical protein
MFGVGAQGVSRAKLVSPNYGESSNCGNNTVVSGSATLVTNLTRTITTSGRPVVINLKSDGLASQIAGADSYFTVGAPGAQPVFNVRRNGAVIAEPYLLGVRQFNNTDFQMIDSPGAGTYTYTITTKTLGGGETGAILCVRVKLLVYEL